MIEIKAYAKINLTLDVLGQRDDGYHEIDSLIQTVELYDTLALERSPEMRIAINGYDAPSDERNLVWQASVLLMESCGLEGGVSATITKRIPSQAGLGGGSSDAAAALLGTAQLYGVKPTERELMVMAAKLGSDVPFFLTGGTARMRGRGEIIEPLPDAPEMRLVIVWPGFGISTEQAYRLLDERNITSAAATEKALQAAKSSDVEGLEASMSNDFEYVVLAERPRLAELKAELLRFGAKSAFVSGSGSAVVGMMRDSDHAQEVANQMRKEYSDVWASRTVSRNQVLEGLNWTL